MKVTAGQKVFIVETDLRGKSREPKEANVFSVGRKYFTIDDHFKTQFLIENGVEKSENNYKATAYLSLEEILDEREHEKLSGSIRKQLNGWGKLKYSLDQLRRIDKILNEPSP